MLDNMLEFLAFKATDLVASRLGENWHLAHYSHVPGLKVQSMSRQFGNRLPCMDFSTVWTLLTHSESNGKLLNVCISKNIMNS